MIDFDLTSENLIREDSTKVKLKGNMIDIKYMLHHDEFPNPTDPLGTPKDLWCLHVKQINQTYIDISEELVFEALHEFFEEDFIRYFAMCLLKEREKRENDK